jgi:hypothetical protein
MIAVLAGIGAVGFTHIVHATGVDEQVIWLVAANQ